MVTGERHASPQVCLELVEKDGLRLKQHVDGFVQRRPAREKPSQCSKIKRVGVVSTLKAKEGQVGLHDIDHYPRQIPAATCSSALSNLPMRAQRT